MKYMQRDIRRIYQYADIFHCEPIEKVADDFINRCHIPQGSYDLEGRSHYEIPDYWDIGEVFERLIEDVSGETIEIDTVVKVFSSWIADRILDFNSDMYYQPREYIACCYIEGKILDG